MKVRIADVVVPTPWTRELIPEHVAVLAAKFEQGVQVEPIVIAPDGTLISGLHRLEAAKTLGWSEIEAVVLDVCGDDLVLATIDAAIADRSHTVLEQSELMARREQLLTDRGQRATVGHPAADDTTDAPAVYTTEQLAAEYGLSKPTYLRRLRIAAIDPGYRFHLKRSVIADDAGCLLRFANLPEDLQMPVAEILCADDGPTTVAAASSVIRRFEELGRPKQQTDDETVTEPQRTTSILHRVAATACTARGIDLDGLGITVDDADGRAQIGISLPVPADNPDLLVALQTINRDAVEIERTKAAITDAAAQPCEWKQLASPADLAAVSPGQIHIDWLDDHSGVQYSRDGVLISQVPASRVAKNGSYIKQAGNTKTESVISIINGWGDGCGRGGTGHRKCETCCFCSADGNFRTGCFAADTAYANHRELRGIYDICLNGIRNPLQKLRLPRDGSFVLNSDPAWGPIGRRVHRVDSESSDVSASVATGLIQMFAEQNERHLFYGISSNYFRPSDSLMRWLAALDNVWVLHSVSAWFDAAETEMRFAAIERFLEFGIPTAISIITDPTWSGNDAILDRALKLVAPEAVQEAPHQIGKQVKHLPIFEHNPLGACGDNRFDRDGHLVHGEYTEAGKIRYFRHLPDGTRVRAHGGAHPRCVGCKLLCGATALGFADAAKLAPPPLVLATEDDTQVTRAA